MYQSNKLGIDYAVKLQHRTSKRQAYIITLQQLQYPIIRKAFSVLANSKATNCAPRMSGVLHGRWIGAKMYSNVFLRIDLLSTMMGQTWYCN